MKILHINTATSGGAAIAAIRIHKGLLDFGIDSHFLTLLPSIQNIPNHHIYSGSLKATKPNYPSLSLKNWMFEKIYRKYDKENNLYLTQKVEREKLITPKMIDNIQNFGLYSFPDSTYDITETKVYEEADIIHLHWVAGFLDFDSFFKKNKKPIVWTLHDANPFLGGFHHKDDLERNIKQYGELEAKLIQQKKDLYSNVANMTIVSPSFWLAEDARNSNVFGNHQVLTIRNGIDFTIFQKRDFIFSRQLLNLPIDKRVFLIASSDLSDYRKGIDLILPIIESKEFQNDIFLLVGDNFKSGKYPNVIALGGIHDEILMSVVYSSANIFILPSRLDNLPNTMLESIACGTPVYSFDIGDNENFIGNQGKVFSNQIQMSLFLMKIDDSFFDFENQRSDFELKNIVNQYNCIYKKISLA